MRLPQCVTTHARAPLTEPSQRSRSPPRRVDTGQRASFGPGCRLRCRGARARSRARQVRAVACGAWRRRSWHLLGEVIPTLECRHRVGPNRGRPPTAATWPCSVLLETPYGYPTGLDMTYSWANPVRFCCGRCSHALGGGTTREKRGCGSGAARPCDGRTHGGARRGRCIHITPHLALI